MKTPFFALASIAVALGMQGCATHHAPEHEAAAPAHAAEPTISPGTKFALLPVPVQNSIRAHAGMSDIADINKVAGTEPEVYEVTFRDFPKLYIASNGDLVNEADLGGLGAPMEAPGTSSGADSTATLPYAVQHTLQQAAPNAPVAAVQRQRRMVYEFTFHDPQRHPKLAIAEDGTILKEPPY